MTILDLKPVFAKRPEENGGFKYKFRLAVRGFAQKYGIDFDETYSPTVQFNTVKVILHLAAHYNWESYHLDVGCAYMEAPPERRLFVKVSKALQKLGFCDSDYAELGTNIYGTKQAGRVWYQYMAKKMLEFGTTRAAFDVCVFYKRNKDNTLIMIVMVYVDDYGITGNWTEEIDKFRNYMKQIYLKIKEISPIHKYIGLELLWNKDNHTVTITQKEYCKNMVEEMVPENISIANTPMHYTVNYREPGNGEFPPIWDVVGKVRFLVDRSRPDLAVATGILGSHAIYPNKIHIKGMHNLLKYLKGTTDYGIVLGGKYDINPDYYCDSNHVTEKDCRPTWGYCGRLCKESGVAIHKSKKATVVTYSVDEGETKAAAEACRSIVWLRNALEELGIICSQPTILHTDSQVLINVVSDYKNHPKSGCYNRDIQWIRECIERRIVKMVKVSSEDNTADILTKLLNETTHNKHSNTLLYGDEK